MRLAIFTGRGHGELIRDTFGQILGLGVRGRPGHRHHWRAADGVFRRRRSGGALWPAAPRIAADCRGRACWPWSLPGPTAGWSVSPSPSACSSWRSSSSPGQRIPMLPSCCLAVMDIPFRNADYRYLAAANIGAVIMPWMIFYQQSAVADKRLRPEHLTAARWDTAIGALLTQLIMAAVLIACAATIGRRKPSATLTTVGEMAQALTPFTGYDDGQSGVRPGRAGSRHGRRHCGLTRLCLGSG